MMRNYPRRAQEGVTLIEILVALVLLAVGLLGLAGLQLRGMQVNQGSMWRSQAAVMAEDLIDRMRADPLDAQQFSSTAGFYSTFTAATVPSTAFAPMIGDWLQALASMPSGTMPSTATDPNGNTLDASCANVVPCAVVKPLATGVVPTPVQVVIYWNDARAAKGAGPSAAASSASTIGSYTALAEVSNSF